MGLERFEQLDAWQGAHALVLSVYDLTKTMPADERYGLVSQMRRAAVSVPANIAEGFKRQSASEKARFYNIAQGLLEELRYFFILCRDLGYTNDYLTLEAHGDRVSRMLNGLIKGLSSLREGSAVYRVENTEYGIPNTGGEYGTEE